MRQESFALAMMSSEVTVSLRYATVKPCNQYRRRAVAGGGALFFDGVERCNTPRIASKYIP
jgi:hypothetical protein